MVQKDSHPFLSLARRPGEETKVLTEDYHNISTHSKFVEIQGRFGISGLMPRQNTTTKRQAK